MTGIAERLQNLWEEEDDPVVRELYATAHGEIERLRGILQFHETARQHEVEGLRAEIERLQGVVVSGDREIKASHADCDWLRAKIAWLEAALREIADNAMDNATATRAERALEGK